jgi:hypothetical protein
MTSTTLVYPEPVSIVREGWKLLVEQLGIEKATQFIMLIERGKGDTVQEIIEYWGDASIEEIHNRVLTWKAKKGTTTSASAVA